MIVFVGDLDYIPGPDWATLSRQRGHGTFRPNLVRDGKEIFCRESLRLTAVAVKAKGDTVELSAPSTLFEVAAHQARHHTSARSCCVGTDISGTRWAAVDAIVCKADADPEGIALYTLQRHF